MSSNYTGNSQQYSPCITITKKRKNITKNNKLIINYIYFIK